MGKKARKQKADRGAIEAAKIEERAAGDAALEARARRGRALSIGIPVVTVVLAVVVYLAFEHRAATALVGVSGLAFWITVLLGVGGAALVVALIEGVVAQDVAGQYGAICDQTGDPTACPASEAARLDGLASDFELHRGLAWGFFAGGLAVAAAGGALLALGLSEGGSSDAPQAGLGCGPDGCRISVRGRF